MKEIKLTKEKITLIDDEDFGKISQYNWCFSKGYALRAIYNNGKSISILLHRFLMNPKRNEFIDHINHNTLDNQKKNLRIVTKQQNAFNSLRASNNTSGYKGVSFMKGKGRQKRWRAVIKINQKYINIGYFNNKIEAAKAYDKRALELFGEFANLNYAS